MYVICAGESKMGPIVRQIMDHPRCAQLQEGDVLMEANGEKVKGYDHSLTVLKRYPKGYQATFLVHRQSKVTIIKSTYLCIPSVEVC